METRAILETIRMLFRDGRITKQQMKTYRGQVLSGNGEAALVGMRRKKLIE